ncbi:hypothetical protein G195_006127 [Phytophthora kernoviae 00238/432]|uniref:Uncharacterized protein n=1 Tax=Phytophthora kernoviae 00238/432 TaxID=1284355 RepID=A0A8J4SGQ3_9STRA|nr:hypothetical protein G195_006127 [Phytophthora kernoviae 00238/432]
MNVRWTNDTLQEKVCKHALSMSESSDVAGGIVKDTIVVTHSMGALMVAGGIANKKCSFDDSTTWVSMSAPMSGTMASNYVQDICTDDDTKAFRQILSLLGKCPVKDGMKSLAYQGGKYSTMDLNNAFLAAQVAYRDNVDAIIVEFKSGKHDGFVEFESCRGGFPETKFSASHEDRFYVTKCNHADTAFLHGNSYFKETMQPVRWFECLL